MGKNNMLLFLPLESLCSNKSKPCSDHATSMARCHRASRTEPGELAPFGKSGFTQPRATEGVRLCDAEVNNMPNSF